jgi:hypothetical protein
MSLLDAADALDILAAGRVPDRDPVIAGAQALESLHWQGQMDRDLEDARVALQLLAISGPLESNQIGRRRAALLADVVRRFATEVSNRNTD